VAQAVIRLEPLGATVSTEVGAPLREVLFDFGVEFPCGGDGRCKRCRVRVLEGQLEGGDCGDGWRLSCRASVSGNVTLEIGQWESNILSDETPFDFEPRRGLGVAIDLGTTTLVAQLVDLQTASVLGVRTALNPQARYGADVMTRVQYALSADGLGTLAALIRRELGRMIAELVEDRATPSVVTIVGNTVMQHLFCGFDVAPLAAAPFEPLHSEEVEFSARSLEWPRASGAAIRFLPNLGGFVGSDVLAGIVATGLAERDDVTVLVDLGTNGEIVIGNRERMICASTAMGPAFEGGRISCGMRAATGAISAVEVGGGELRCHVIGGGRARGICGSGLVDAVACGLEIGAIRQNGRMAEPLALTDGIEISQADVRQVQLAKGAIAGGLRVLQRRFGGNVRRVSLAGAFGNYINVRSARRIGLLEFAEELIQPSGNTALLGAKRALFGEIAASVEHVALAADPEFEDAYISAMSFAEAI